MQCLFIHDVKRFTLATLLMFLGVFADSANAQAIITRDGTAAIHLATQGNSTFVVAGTAPHFGKYRGYGEVTLQPGEATGSMAGVGVGVVQAADGDLLAAIVTLRVSADGSSQVRFSWRDSVEFSDGTVVATTGRFVTHRPPGLLVVIAIIAILIGL
jgi:hypothetical protein